MNDSTTKYDPIGFCIYCKASGSSVLLTDEHIIPYGLGGRFLFLQASCKECEKITSKFERKCLREMLGNFRIHSNYPTRRKKERPKSLIANIIVDGQIEAKEVPVEDHPSIIILPGFHPPGLLRGESNLKVHREVRFWFKDIQGDVQSRIKRIDAEKVRMNQAFPAGAFFRLLAKIAHGFAIAQYGPKAFKPFLPDLILDHCQNIPDYIGNVPEDFPQDAIPEALHEIKLQRKETEGAIYLVANIQLFANLGAPIYQVVVGELDK